MDESKSNWTGLQLVTLGVVLQLIGGGVVTALDGESPVWQELLAWIPLIASLPPYLIGYRRALKEKNYPGILFLAAFTGLIGTILIYLLPEKTGE
ncbi:MAG: hypothetical protein P1U89_21490 [Verrucomicrobiales bacterium]|nr:hypothetical protein [Verrucomicrobiales bacterium]